MQRDRHKAVWLRMLSIKEIRMARDTKKLLRTQASQIVAAYKKGGHAEAESTANGLTNTWLKVLVPNYIVTIRDFAAYTQEQLNPKSKKDFVDITTAFIERQGLFKARELTNTTKEILTRVIRNGEQDGLGVEAIAKNISQSIGGSISDSRARTIARTETHMAAGFGMQEQAKDAGYPVNKVWVAVEDDRTRETHTFVDGTEIAIDDNFQVGNDLLQYPGDPNGSPEETINCRCTLIYTPVGEIF